MRGAARTALSEAGGLLIGGARDPAETAADRLAERALRGPGEARVARRECRECADEEGAEGASRSEPARRAAPAARVAAGAAPVRASAATAAAIAAQAGGEPLPASERSFFEPRFGADLSDVRIHAGPSADRAAEQLDARAFALGSGISFARDEYRPRTASGRRLLAHELAHVVQDRGRARRRLRRVPNCGGSTDETRIVASHTVKSPKIDSPGDRAKIRIRFSCKPRSLYSEIADPAGKAIRSIQRTKWNGGLKLSRAGLLEETWNGKRSFHKVGTFMADDGRYKHRVRDVAYAAGRKKDKVARGTVSSSPDIKVGVRGGITATSHLGKGATQKKNIETMAKALRTEAGASFVSQTERRAVGWAIRNIMARVNTDKVAAARAAVNFRTGKTPAKADRRMAKAILSQDMSKETAGGAIKWYSPRSMPPNHPKTKCKKDGGKASCGAGIVALASDPKKSSYAPKFHDHMTYVNVAGVKEWNFRFYKL